MWGEVSWGGRSAMFGEKSVKNGFFMGKIFFLKKVTFLVKKDVVVELF